MPCSVWLRDSGTPYAKVIDAAKKVALKAHGDGARDADDMIAHTFKDSKSGTVYAFLFDDDKEYDGLRATRTYPDPSAAIAAMDDLRSTIGVLLLDSLDNQSPGSATCDQSGQRR